MPPDEPQPEVTLAQVYTVVLETRATVEKHTNMLHDLGLNGNTPLLKAFLAQYGATYVSRQAWQVVRGDILHRLRFLAPGKHWLGILLAGALGAIGWQAVASAHLTWPLH